MTWMHQVWHVHRRDLRRTWFLLALYAAVLCLAVARALEWPPAMHTALSPVGLIATVLAVLATVRAVHADDTTRADAFWAVVPLQSSAVAASKLLYVLSVVAAYGAATLVIRAAWQLGPIGWDGAHAMYPVLTLTLLGMALAASVFGTMTSIGAVVSGTLGFAFAGRAIYDLPQKSMAPSLWWSAVTLLVVGCTAFLVRRYHTRETTVLTRGAALGTGALAMLFPVFGLRSMPGEGMVEYDPTHTLDSVSLTLPLTTPPVCEGGRLAVPVSLKGPPVGLRVGLRRPTLDVALDDGSTLKLSLSTSSFVPLPDGYGPLLLTDRQRSQLRVVGLGPDTGAVTFPLEFAVTPADSGRVCGHLERLAIRAWVVTETGVEVMRVPLRNAAGAAAPRNRVRIISQAIRDSSVTIRARLSGVTDDFTRSPELGFNAYALLNTARGEVVPLTHSRETDPTWTSGLPGGMRHSGITLDFGLQDPQHPRLGGLESWRDGSVLLVTAPRLAGRGWRSSPSVAVPHAPNRSAKSEGRRE
ncbi:MAG: hypothetical protein IT355_02620 [Gemmatimonadaceae bacterium]|nr:hypothetical protein [Gemmatimonadaceae bacterium]